MKESLVIILFDHPLIHTSDYASQTGRYLKRNNVVIGMLMKDAYSLKELFLSSREKWIWKKRGAAYYLYKPLYIIPFRRYKRIVHINNMINVAILKIFTSVLQRRRNLKKRYLWIFNPEQYSIMKQFGTSCISLYDCVDYHGHEPSSQEERALINECNHVFVNSNVLYNIHRNIRRSVTLVPQGFDLEGFSNKLQFRTAVLPHNQPIVGYVGGINSRLDYPLLISLAKNTPHVNFVFIGPIQMHETDTIFKQGVMPHIISLLSFKNVYHYPYVPKQNIPQIIKQIDIASIPYDSRKEFNSFSFPMKVFEYFYFGKPVLSTPIQELKRYPKFVKFGTNYKEWQSHIKYLLKNPWPARYRKEQQQEAKANSWEEKISDITTAITDAECNSCYK